MATKPEGALRNPEDHARWGCVVLLFGWLCVLGLGAALAARDATEWYAPLVVIAVAWVAARPMTIAPIARLFGTVSGR